MGDNNNSTTTAAAVLPHTVPSPDEYPSGFTVTAEAGINWVNDSGYSTIEIQFAGTSPVSLDGTTPTNNLTISKGSPKLTHVIGKQGVYPYIVHYHCEDGDDKNCRWKGMHFLSISHCLGCAGG